MIKLFIFSKLVQKLETMKREILFRGRCIITGVWRYGFYYTSNGNSIIRDKNNNESIVIPETVGQFTGLTDKNGVKIFENCQINHEWKIIFKFNRYILVNILKSDIFEEILIDGQYEITSEYY